MYKCITGSLKESDTASTVLLVEKQDAKRLHSALTNSILQNHNWSLRRDNIDSRTLPPCLGYYILQSVPDELPASEPEILELVVKGVVSMVKTIVVEIRDGKRDYDEETAWVALETQQETYLQVVDVLEKMYQDGDWCYTGTVEVMSRAEFRASVYHARCRQRKLTKDIFDGIVDSDDQHETLRWLS